MEMEWSPNAFVQAASTNRPIIFRGVPLNWKAKNWTWDMGAKFQAGHVDKRTTVPRGVLVERNPNGDFVCLHCRQQAEKMKEKAEKRNFAGGVLNASTMVVRDEEEATEKEELAATREKKKEAAEKNKKEKARLALEKEQKINGILQRVRAAMALPMPLNGWDDQAAAAHAALADAVKGADSRWHDEIKAARERHAALEAARKVAGGTALAAANKHAAIVNGHADAIMALLQRVHNAGAFDAAALRGDVVALVEGMAPKF